MWRENNVITADHLNKPDIGDDARRWIDEDKVDAIVGPGSSGVALAVNQLIHSKTTCLHCQCRNVRSDRHGMHCQHGAMDLRIYALADSRERR